MKTSIAAKAVYTTGEVSRICRVAPRTVSKWIDEGALEGYRIPLSHDRRVTREALRRFLVNNGLPSDLMVPNHRKFLLVGCDDATVAACSACFNGMEESEIQTAASIFEAGVKAAEFQPRIVLVDTSFGRIESQNIAYALKLKYGAEVDIVFIGEIQISGDLEAHRIGKPLDVAKLVKLVQSIVTPERAKKSGRKTPAVAI